MTDGRRTYPSLPAAAGQELFLRWVGANYARTVSVAEAMFADGLLTGRATIGRRWSLSYSILDTVSNASTPQFERERGTLERRLDEAGRALALWAPRAAPLPDGQEEASAFLAEIGRVRTLPDGRLEIPRPAVLHLRRTSTTGSVINVLGGLAGHWAQFTNKVPGSFQLDSRALHRLPTGEEPRLELAGVIVQAAAQPTVDDGITIRAEDCWTANELSGGRSYVLGVPTSDSDETSAALRRDLRRLLRLAGDSPAPAADARALVVLGIANYAEDEKLSWALRGMDPRLYAGFDIIAVVTDGVVKPMLQPQREVLPWDAPLG